MRYLVTIFVIIFFIILGIVIFGGSSKAPNPKIAGKTLPDFASTDAKVRVTIDGIINGDEEHRQIRITIGQDQRSLDIIQGYQNRIIKTKTFSNNTSAYDVFLHSINLYGFSRERKTKFTDERGVCPLGQRYIYELTDTGSKKTDFRLWNSSCGSTGTEGGQGAIILELFQAQITGYDDIVATVNI